MNGIMGMGIGLVVFCAVASGAAAAECRSIGGHLNGQLVKATRHVELKPKSMTVSGTLNGKRSPRQSLPCRTIAKGVYCETQFQGVIVTIQTNGRRMIEAVTDPSSRRELASFAYECDRVMKP
ncbi:hypothetical protein [Rhizobium sp. 9140]|uniref:hypothetical protein n=1 Tax=Rhizobium sp. 9140 TaxID=1761900 RepID=UPI00079888A6|nr:hypothetical protein [Rhizobium sp. 9140]CZT36349.1 hypothetical protein GA0004734_00033480 [Rhizobium sp. 9140]